jgi:hypothetical protein
MMVHSARWLLDNLASVKESQEMAVGRWGDEPRGREAKPTNEPNSGGRFFVLSLREIEIYDPVSGPWVRKNEATVRHRQVALSFPRRHHPAPVSSSKIAAAAPHGLAWTMARR